ncbi:MAG: hypothetical protein R3D51_17870 [Hyphomicrobiaceae bacterium]
MERLKAVVEFDLREVLLINNALNEICHGLEIFEFDTRIGVARDKVESLGAEFTSLLDKLVDITGEKAAQEFFDE